MVENGGILEKYRKILDLTNKHLTYRLKVLSVAEQISRRQFTLRRLQGNLKK